MNETNDDNKKKTTRAPKWMVREVNAFPHEMIFYFAKELHFNIKYSQSDKNNNNKKKKNSFPLMYDV